MILGGVPGVVRRRDEEAGAVRREGQEHLRVVVDREVLRQFGGRLDLTVREANLDQMNAAPLLAGIRIGTPTDGHHQVGRGVVEDRRAALQHRSRFRVIVVLVEQRDEIRLLGGEAPIGIQRQQPRGGSGQVDDGGEERRRLRGVPAGGAAGDRAAQVVPVHRGDPRGDVDARPQRGGGERARHCIRSGRGWDRHRQAGGTGRYGCDGGVGRNRGAAPLQGECGGGEEKTATSHGFLPVSGPGQSSQRVAGTNPWYDVMPHRVTAVTWLKRPSLYSIVATGVVESNGRIFRSDFPSCLPWA